jgi:hypothetical protein
MNSEKKLTEYTINDDEPYKNQLYFTMSFLTPKYVDPIKHLDVSGFKVLGCHPTYEDASSFSSKVEEDNPKFDVYIGEIGKRFPWDDQSKVENVEYKNKKLNDMDRAYRESQGKVKLIKKQIENERGTDEVDPKDARKATIMDRLRTKLKDKGIITENELRPVEKNAVKVNRKEVQDAMDRMATEMMAAKDEDFLDENEVGAYRFGCATFYSNKYIVNLDEFSFKIRGFAVDYEGIIKRTNKLKAKYPNDKIFIFEVGKWTPYTDSEDTPEMQLIKLNYGVKMYVDYFEKSKDDYNKRKELLKATAKKTNKRLKKARAAGVDTSATGEAPQALDMPEPEIEIVAEQPIASEEIKVPKTIFENIGDADELTLKKMTEIEKIYEQLKKQKSEAPNASAN